MLTAPKTVREADYVDLIADPANGAVVFAAAGCASCHNARNAEAADRLLLVGGKRFPSPFGEFKAPGLAFAQGGPQEAWSLADFANAITQGVSPDGKHYYPALPYTTYNKMAPQDVVDLFAYMKTLPLPEITATAHEVSFPFNIRRSLGGWKLLNLRNNWHADMPEGADPEVFERGRYLVEAMGHCTECHTARNVIGGLKTSEWLKGAPNPSGKGKIPNITPAALDWSDLDLMAYFQTGLTPEYDSAGGEMADVIDNLKTLPEGDLLAIVAYLKALS